MGLYLAHAHVAGDNTMQRHTLQHQHGQKANKVLGIYDVSTGGISGTVADPRVIFVAALKANATSIIISHNHPSGNLKPSRQDEELTQKIKQCGQLLEIRLLEHMIVSNEGFYSFADEGLL